MEQILKNLWCKLLVIIGLRYKLKFIEDIIDDREIDKNTIYAVGNALNYWCIVFKCPCGCNEKIILNALGNHPSWKITNPTPVSIKPSIDRLVDCKSHFWIKEGKVIFVK